MYLKELSLKQIIVEILRARCLSYFGHIGRMNSSKCSHMLLHGPGGNCPRDWWRKRRFVYVAENCKPPYLLVVL